MVARPLPLPVRGRALIDTGTQMSLISGRIAQTLGLDPTRSTVLRTATGRTATVCYAVSFSFVSRGTPIGSPQDLIVGRADILQEDMLLGLDVLRHSHLEWNGPAATLHLRPQYEPVCHVIDQMVDCKPHRLLMST
ncbi:retroviral-like aspartic protease family protein [Candidatus Poriferisodalis sp.]|uniref:retroviral-like aspartic protease family protein n=1 Tax=Candidatus Poriferisodalis sp. TaxID=3101277 RepID=UPI003B5B96E4